MAQNYILVWSVISPKVCCKIGSIVFPSLAVPESKRIGRLRPSLGKQPRTELLLAASAAHHMRFCISFSPLSLYFLVPQCWGGLAALRKQHKSSGIMEIYFLFS